MPWLQHESNGAWPERKEAPKTNKRSLGHIKIHITAFAASSGVKRSGWVMSRPANPPHRGLMAARVDACPLIATWQEHDQKRTDVYDVAACGQTRISLSQTRAKRASWTDPGFPAKTHWSAITVTDENRPLTPHVLRPHSYARKGYNMRGKQYFCDKVNLKT